MKTNKEKQEINLLEELFRSALTGEILSKINNDSVSMADPDISIYVKSIFGFDPTGRENDGEDYWDIFSKILKTKGLNHSEMALEYHNQMKSYIIQNKINTRTAIMLQGIISDALHNYYLIKPLEEHLNSYSFHKTGIGLSDDFYGVYNAYYFMEFEMSGDDKQEDLVVEKLDEIFIRQAEKYKKAYYTHETEADLRLISEKIYELWTEVIEAFEYLEDKEPKLSKTA